MASYDIFISHAWNYDERYQGIVRLLDSVSGFAWRDYSAPRDHPAVDPNTEVGRNTLRALLRERVRQSSCFVLVAGMYINNRYWVQAEIDFANEYNKPIIGVRRRGQQRTPVEVENIASEMVNWNSVSITDAIRRHVDARRR